LTGRAFELWSQLEVETGTPLIRAVGGLDFGANRDVATLARHLSASGVEHEVLTAAAAAERWPGMAFEGEVVFHPQAGTLDADGAVSTMLTSARSHGAEVSFDTVVTAVRPAGDEVAVALADGTELRAERVVLAAGAWLPGVLDGVVELPPLRVTRQSVFHFARRDPAGVLWPSTIHDSPSGAHYHLAGGGVRDDRKLGQHATRAAPVRAGRDVGVIDGAARDRAVTYVRRWLPGLDPRPRDETTCLYTSTPSEDFVLDSVGPLVVCSPCSGHGAKFAPLIGELVTSLVLGGTRGVDPVPPRFRLAAHAGGHTGTVSL
jgi:sarcosine oxidase